MRRWGLWALAVALCAALPVAYGLPPSRAIVPAASSLPSGIPATKIGDGSISNTEFGYLNNVSSNIQTQLNAKLTTPSCSDGQTLVYASGTPACASGSDVIGWTLVPLGEAASISVSNPDVFYLPATQGAASTSIGNDQLFWRAPAAGTVKHFTVVITDSGMGGSLICALKKADVPTSAASLSDPATAISVTLTDGTGQKQGTTSTSSTVASGDYYTVRCAPQTGATAAGKIRVYTYFKPDAGL